MIRLKRIFVILMMVIMIVPGMSLGAYDAFSYAVDEVDNSAASATEQGSDAKEDAEKPVANEETENTESAQKPEATEPVKPTEEPAVASELKTSCKLSDDSVWKITASFDENAGIPEDAALNIGEIDTEKHDDYLNEAKKELKLGEKDDLSCARFFSIAITNKGKAIEPTAKVEFTVESKDISKNIDLIRVVRLSEKKPDQKTEAKELKCSTENDKSIIFETDEMAVFGFIAPKENSAPSEDEDLVHRTLKAEQVRLEGMMPEGAKVIANDVTDTKAVKKLEEKDDGTAIAAYDITIKSDEEEFQPDEDEPISVRITNKAISEDSHLSIWHIKDDGTREEIKDFTVSEGKVTFSATGFSVYVVIDHEDEVAVTPRVQFHFISPDAEEGTEGSTVYYKSDPYTFNNKHNDKQKTQILKDGESLELIADPPNQETKYFYGWYVVDPHVISGTTDDYGIGKTDSKLYYTWPSHPDQISFEKPISITESNVDVGSDVHWKLNGVSGSGSIDSDGNVHVFLAPVFEKYTFVNFMLHARDDLNNTGSKSLMTRKLIAIGSSDSVEVKISDVRSNSKDSVHLIFTGWEYNAGTEENPDWQQYQTVDHTGAEIKDEGKDGVYLTKEHLEDGESIDLYPMFVEARWVDFVSGPSGSGASYVPSRFLKSWGPATPPSTPEEEGENVLSSLQTSTYEGYTFDGWYAFAVTNGKGEITNLETPAEVKVNYLAYDQGGNYSIQTTTINTKAIKITDENGDVCYNGTYSLNTGSGTVDLFGGDGSKLKFFDSLDRLKLYAKWQPGNSKITVAYWTEKAQDKDYVSPENEKDDYTASAVKTITTSDINSQLGTSYKSGSSLTLSSLKEYQDGSIGVLDEAYLDNVGAVPAGEEKFYELNDSLSDASVVISGDGNTVINVYYSRKEFTLVFHIGRDGYVKNGGNQKTDDNWDGNWIEFMYNDSAVTALGYPKPGEGRSPSPSYQGNYTMTYVPDNKIYSSQYVTDNNNVMGDYLPDPDNVSNDQNLYTIKAKYGAYIADRWPSPVNTNFRFTNPQNSRKTMYIWAAYYGSLYCRIANERDGDGSDNNRNPDINGVYSYMSEELCSDRSGNHIINENCVHHLVAWYGEANNAKRFKQYHILYEAIDGTYDPSIPTVPGSDYEQYNMTSWSQENTSGDMSEIRDHTFIEPDPQKAVLSNLDPKYQLGENLDGYELVYSCYDPTQRDNPSIQGQKDYHVYFFYRPKQYSLTFKYEDESERKTDQYYYTQSLANAKKPEYEDPSKEGYEFMGWYTNEAGIGEPFDFANEKMPCANLVLYPVMRPLQYVVKIDPNGGVIDHINHDDPSASGIPGEGYQTSQATYFNAYHGTTIGEYNVERNYIMLTENEKASYTGTKYYYINSQFNEDYDGDWGLYPDLRNAIFVEESQLQNYYNYYCAMIDAHSDYYTGVTKLLFDDFKATYTSYPDTPYRKLMPTEHYSFMGWYQVYDDGSEASMPYNFNDPAMGPLTLRAKWRLDGGYYIIYDPCFNAEDGTEVVGEVDQWTDPEDPSKQLYADQSVTNVLRAPTVITPDWVFRGWRVVRAEGDDWVPIQFDDDGNVIYYQPGDKFTVDSDLVTEHGEGSTDHAIHMQAYYETLDTSYRRPKVTHLILDSNKMYGGYVNTTDPTSLPALAGPGSTSINDDTSTYLDGHPTQILFGDFQSNLALHLYRYATTETYRQVAGRNYFTNNNGYLLIGFDEETDPENPSTGSAYIPKYASDSVASVVRKDNKDQETLYAMWEPMVYATFVNTTDEPITIELTGSGASTVSVINEVTGKFDREKSTTTITVPAKSGNKNGEVKVVFPKAVAGTDSITATAVNYHVRKKMSVSGKFKTQKPYGNGSEKIKNGEVVTYTGTLQTDKDGIIVTYTEEDDLQVIYDVNGGVWTETSEYYHQIEGDEYFIDKDDIVDNKYKPSDPTRSGKIFIGWTTNADIAGHTDFSSTSEVTWGDTTITPDSGSIVLDKVRSDYLWDFSKKPPYEQILYAVWSDTVTVTFDIVRTGNNLHVWSGPTTKSEPESYVYYRSSENSGAITYTMAKGERVPKPEDPTADTAKPTWYFISWLKNTNGYRNQSVQPNTTNIVNNTFDFSQRVLQNTTLYTSWTELRPQHYTFTVKNEIVDGNTEKEFDYTIAVSNELVRGRFNHTPGNVNIDALPDRRWGSVTTTLKNNEEYTVHVTVRRMIGSGWEAYSSLIEVVDCNGATIKSGDMVYCGRSNNKTFTSDYKYTLTITQDTAEGFQSVETQYPTGPIQYYSPNPGPDSESRSFTFDTAMTTSNLEVYKPEKNVYSNQDCSLKIIFKNKTPNIAPTAVRTVLIPFALILAAGLAIIVINLLAKRRRIEDD